MTDHNLPNFENLSFEAKENIRNRVFRVFISSTFNDMQRERDSLVQDVFPRFTKRCKERDVEFVPIDLRWGVTKEQKNAGEAIEICRREVRRSHPFFIGLVGERYGWTPKKEDFDRSAFEEVPSLKEAVEKGLSICEIGYRFSVLNETNHMEAGYWIRSEKMPTPDEHREKEEAQQLKLMQFKKELRTQKKVSVCNYDSSEDLGKQIENVLNQWLDQYFPKGEKRTWLDKQNDQQSAFERSHTGTYNRTGDAHTEKKRSIRKYVPKQADYEKLNEFVTSTNQTLVVVGASGLGKSALLANWRSDCARKFSDIIIFSHYVSASENSDSPADILHRLTGLLDPNVVIEKSPQLELTFKQKTLDDFIDEFDTTIRQYLADNPQKRLLFVIDGLNHVTETEESKDLSWLPSLPKRAQYLLSTVNDDRYTTEAIHRRKWGCYKIEGLDKEQRTKIIADFLANRGKTLHSTQIDKISYFSLSSNPLVLKTLLNELCYFGLFEEFDKEIDRYLQANDINDFFNKVFDRLETNNQFITTDKLKRKEIVEKLALLLTLSRFGLNENELSDVAEYELLPILTFLGALNAQLVNRSGRYSFAHTYIRQAALNRYDKKIVDMRRLLIEKFLELEPENERRLQEVPFQYLQLESWEELRLFLLDFDVLDKLYNETFNCDFCMYWNAVIKKGRKELRFASFLELKPSDLSQWYNLAHIAQVYTEFSTAEKAYQEASVLLRHLSNANPNLYTPGFAGTLGNLALVHSDTNHLDKAEKEYKEVLTLYQKLVEKYPSMYKSHMATSLNNLANLHSKTNSLDEAEKEYREALEIRRLLAEEKSNTYKPYVAISLNNLALLHSKTNRFNEAEEEYKEALEIRRLLVEESPNTYKPGLAMTLNSLAVLHSETNRLVEAEKEYKEALTLYRQLAEEKPNVYKPDFAMTLNDLANLHSVTNHLDEAEKEYKKALALYRQLAEETPKAYKPYVATSLNNLASLHSDMNRLEEAEKEYKEALETRRLLVKENPGTYKPDFAITLNNLAILHYSTNHLKEAEKEYKEALELYQQLVKEAPNTYKPDFAMILNNLANLHYFTNRLEEAEKEYREALGIRRLLAQETPSVYKPDFAMTLNNLANLHSVTNHLDEAEKEYKEALEIRQLLVKENSSAYKSDFAMTLNNLAILHSETNRLGEAEREYKEVLALYRLLAKENPNSYKPYVATLLNNLANLHSGTHHLEEAEKEYKEGLEIRRLLAQESPMTYKPVFADTLIDMAIFYFTMGRTNEVMDFVSQAITIYKEFARISPVYEERLKNASSLQENIRRNINPQS